MKVFISWSGERSNKIAEVLKKWIKRVVQSVEPFVSSQDIEKGARWSTDIAKELQDSNFGILCVTKDNFQEPWLLFEAGALSKTMEKSLVVPLLFGIEPSDLSGSPLLQFQATLSSKDEIKKLVDTINAKSENRLDTHELDDIFEQWYPKLEEWLNEIPDVVPKKEVTEEKESLGKSSIVLEEILSLSRDNQRLLRNPENNMLKEIAERIDRVTSITERNDEYVRRKRKYSPMMLDELLHVGRKVMSRNYAFLVAISFFREDYPWIYELGRDLFDTLKSNKSQKQKESAINDFREMLDFSIHSFRMDKRINNKEDMMFMHEACMMLMHFVDENLPNGETTE